MSFKVCYIGVVHTSETEVMADLVYVSWTPSCAKSMAILGFAQAYVREYPSKIWPYMVYKHP